MYDNDFELFLQSINISEKELKSQFKEIHLTLKCLEKSGQKQSDFYIQKEKELSSILRKIKILSNGGLATYISKRYTLSFDNIYSFTDILHIGIIGLIKGIDTYDPELKTKLPTYVSRCIQNEILMEYRKVKKLKECTSINKIIEDEDGNEITLQDLLPNAETDIEQGLIGNELLIDLEKYIEFLSEKEKKVVHYRFFEGKTQKETGEALGFVSTYICAIEQRAIKKLKEMIRKHENIIIPEGTTKNKKALKKLRQTSPKPSITGKNKTITAKSKGNNETTTQQSNISYGCILRVEIGQKEHNSNFGPPFGRSKI